jgi:hypothetical protein
VKVFFAVLFLSLCVFGFSEGLSKANVLSWKANFRLPTANEIEVQRQRVKAALSACKSKIKANANANDLLAEWKIPELEEQMARSLKSENSEAPESVSDSDLLSQVLAALKVDKAPLEKNEFHRLRVEIANYRALVMSADPVQKDRYQTQIDTIGRLCDLPRYTPEEERELRAALSGLAASGQAAPLIKWWSTYKSLPNFSARVSGAFLSRMTHQTFAQSQPVAKDTRDPATGQMVHLKGSASFNGYGEIRLVPDTQRARAEVGVKATAQGNVTATTNVMGRTAQVQVLSQSTINGGIPIEVLPDLSPKIGQIQLAVHTQTTPYNPSFEARLPIIRRIGARKVLEKAQENVPQSNRETETLIDSEIRPQVEGKIEPLLAPLMTAANNTFHYPLLRAERFPRLAFSTDSQNLEARGWFADRDEFGSFVPETGLSGGDAALSIHESILSNAGRALSNKLLGEGVVRKALFSGMLKQPEEDIQTGVVESELLFAKENPVSATIQDGRLGIRIALQSFTLDEKRYDIPCTLAARWKISINDATIELTREGEPEIQGGETLTKNKRATKGLPLLADRLLIPRAVAKLEPLKFDFPGNKIDIQLRIAQFRAESGWLAVKLEAKRD